MVSLQDNWIEIAKNIEEWNDRKGCHTGVQSNRYGEHQHHCKCPKMSKLSLLRFIHHSFYPISFSTEKVLSILRFPPEENHQKLSKNWDSKHLVYPFDQIRTLHSIIALRQGAVSRICKADKSKYPGDTERESPWENILNKTWYRLKALICHHHKESIRLVRHENR